MLRFGPLPSPHGSTGPSIPRRSRDTREKREPAYRAQIDEQVQSTTGMIQKLNKDMATVIEHQIG